MFGIFIIISIAVLMCSIISDMEKEGKKIEE